MNINLHQSIANLKQKFKPSTYIPSHGGEYGTSADQKGTTVNSGVAVILAGSVSVVVAHGIIGVPKVSLIGSSFVFLKRSVDATNITIEIDAPQISDTYIDWMATL